MSERDVPESGRPRASHASSIDAVIAVYQKDIDQTLLRENLKLTPQERLQKQVAVLELVDALAEARDDFPAA